MTNKSTLDDWEEQVRNMVYEVWTSHSSSKHMVELVGKLLQAQRERDAEIVTVLLKTYIDNGIIVGPLKEAQQEILNQNKSK